jgi:hypothetical protein
MIHYFFMLSLLLSTTCHAAKIKVRNHTEQDIKVELDLVKLGQPHKHTIEAGDEKEIDTKGYTWRAIHVETSDKKRKGTSGPRECARLFVHKKNDVEFEYHAACQRKDQGSWNNAHFHVFLPSQGKYRSRKNGVVDSPIRDNGKNLIVVKQ